MTGKADILLFPSIESANLTAKGTTYFPRQRLAHSTTGVIASIIIPSRSNSIIASF